MQNSLPRLKECRNADASASGRGYQRKSPYHGRQFNVYVLNFMPESSQPEE
jgi:hypothetical protein